MPEQILDRKEIKGKLSEIAERVEVITDDTVEEPDLELMNNGDSTVWVLEQAIEELDKPEPSLYRLFDTVENEFIGTVKVTAEVSDQRIYELKDIYKADNPDTYNVDGFIEFLEDRGINAEKFDHKEVNF